jgi:hypothetical protein
MPVAAWACPPDRVASTTPEQLIEAPAIPHRLARPAIQKGQIFLSESLDVSERSNLQFLPALRQPCLVDGLSKTQDGNRFLGILLRRGLERIGCSSGDDQQRTDCHSGKVERRGAF